MARPFVDLTGQQRYDWLILSTSRNRHGQKTYICRCNCGRMGAVAISKMSGNRSKRCKTCANHKRPYEYIYNTMLRAAKARSIPVTLTYEQFLNFTTVSECHYCRVPISWAKHSKTKFSAAYHLDRKDNTLGYSEENCTVCCNRCNRVKAECVTYDQMIFIGNAFRFWEDRTDVSPTVEEYQTAIA